MNEIRFSWDPHKSRSNQKKHGVAMRPSGYDGYIIFEGDTFATSDPTKEVRIKDSYKVTFSPSSPSEIVFDQLSGNANYDGDIGLVDPARNMTAVITINHEGKIGW